MKKFNKPALSQNQKTSNVEVAIDEAKLLIDMIEELACVRTEKPFQSKPVIEGWEHVESSSLEAFVSGKVSMVEEENPLKEEFVAPFIFTCVRPVNGDYALCFMNSLS